MEYATDSTNQDEKAAKSTRTFAKVAAGVGLIGLIVSTIGTGIQASHESAGIRPEDSYGSLVRAIGMVVILTAAVGFVGRSVIARNRKKWIDFRNRDAAFRKSIMFGASPADLPEFQFYRPFRVRFLIAAARVCGVLFVGFALIVFATMIAMYASRSSRGLTLIDYWFEILVCAVMVPMAITVLGLLMLAVAEILDYAVLGAAPMRNRTSTIDKNTPVSPTINQH